MTYLAIARQRAQDKLDNSRALVVSAIKAADETSHPIWAAGRGTADSIMGHAESLVKHSEQYTHYTGWIYVAINRIATRVSGQPVHMGRKLLPGEMPQGKVFSPRVKASAPAHIKMDDGEYDVLERHPFLDALANPNDLLVTSSLFCVTVASLELTGKAYWWCPVVNGKTQIWHVPTDWVTPRHTEDKMYAWYDVKKPGQMGEPQKIPAEEMVAFVLPDPKDPHGSIAPTQTQSPAIAADEAIQTAQWRGFRNGLHPGLVVQMGRHTLLDGSPGEKVELSSAQRQEMVGALRAVYEGAVNYGEPVILDKLIENIYPFSRTNAEMDFLDSGKATKSRIMQAFGVNPIIAGEVVGVGWSQASVADDLFVSNVVNPLTAFMGQTITKFLDEPGVCFWIEEATPKNPELKLKKYTAALNGKVPAVTRNEFRREVLNLPPVDGWDDEDLAVVETDQDEPDEEDDDFYRAPERSYKTVAQLRTAAATLFDKQIDGAQADIERAMNKFFRGMAANVVAQLRRVAAESPKLLESPEAADTIVELIYRPVDWRKNLKDAAFTPLARTALVGYTTAKTLLIERIQSAKAEMALRKDVEPLSPEQQEQLDAIVGFEMPKTVRDGIHGSISETLSQDYWGKILDTTGADIRHTLKHGIKKGWSVGKLGKAIAQEVGGDRKRGKLIAETEVTNVMNAGHDAQFAETQDAGLTPIKIWETIGDLWVRETHQPMQGQEARGRPALFNLSGYSVPYPGHYSLPAKERCRCRCGFFTDLMELRDLGLGHDPSQLMPPAWEGGPKPPKPPKEPPKAQSAQERASEAAAGAGAPKVQFQGYRGDNQLRDKHAGAVASEFDRLAGKTKKVRESKDWTDVDRVAVANKDSYGKGSVGGKVTSDGTGGFYDGKKRTIHVAFNPKKPKRPGLAFGEWTVDETPAGALRHEYGHHLFKTLAKDPKAVSEWYRLHEKMREAKALASTVSRYGATNLHESFSESFAAWTHKDYKPGMLPREIESFMETFVGG